MSITCLLRGHQGVIDEAWFVDDIYGVMWKRIVVTCSLCGKKMSTSTSGELL